MGWDILKVLKFHLTNHQEITGYLFPAITKKLMIGMHFQGSAVKSPGPMD